MFEKIGRGRTCEPLDGVMGGPTERGTKADDIRGDVVNDDIKEGLRTGIVRGGPGDSRSTGNIDYIIHNGRYAISSLLRVMN